jgi:hypothetical protein
MLPRKTPNKEEEEEEEEEECMEKEKEACMILAQNLVLARM